MRAWPDLGIERYQMGGHLYSVKTALAVEVDTSLRTPKLILCVDLAAMWAEEGQAPPGRSDLWSIEDCNQLSTEAGTWNGMSINLALS
jgi:hypothetical protein